MKILPLPTDDTDIHKYALCAIAHMNHDIEQGVIQNKPEEMQKLLKGYIETYVRDFQCLSLLAQKHGVAEVEKLRSEFKSLPFIEKMRCMGNRAFLVPGTPARKICNFLLIESLGIFDTALGLSGAEQRNEWLDALTDCGFGGSVMTSAYNRGSIWNIAQTGELDVILLDDNDGFSSKVGYMCNLRDELVKLGMKSVQCFSHGPYSNSIGSPEIRLRKFADEFFPLNQERQ